MLDILILYALGHKIAATAKRKGRRPAGYVVLLVALWAVGEFSGAVAAAIYGTVTAGPGEPGPFVVVAGALLGAIAGAVISFVIVNSLSDVREEFPLRQPDFDGRVWEDRRYQQHFGAADGHREDITADPREQARREDERYRAE
jgi:hypothetical protein